MLKFLAGMHALGDLLENQVVDITADDRGGVVIEYGVIVAVIALGLAVVGGELVTAVDGWFTRLAGELSALPPT